MDIQDLLTNLITTALQSLDLEPRSNIELEHPAELKFGDYSSNVAMQLFKQQDQFKSPRDLAAAIIKEIEQNLDDDSPIEKIEVAGPGFINFYLSEKFFLAQLGKTLSGEIEVKNLNKDKLAIVEYSSPNIAKPFTIGHLRSTIIGDAVANLLEFSGFEVKRDNHLGDWGTQFGKMIYALINLGEGSLEKNIEVISNSEQPVKKLVELYVDFHAQAEEKPEMVDEARAWFKKLEDGDNQARELWQKCIDWSWKEFNQIYQQLNVPFNGEFENGGRGFGESYFEDKMDDVVAELREKKMLSESEGAELVFFEDEKYPPLMILKKDGSTLYATRDLATDKFRLNKYGKDVLIVNEVGGEQSLYFRQIFEVEKMLGWVKDGQRVHVGHGLYRFKEGKMSTRKGNVIWLAEVLAEAVNRAEEMAAGRTEEYEKIAIGALKWNDLKRAAHLDVTFDWDEILSMEGNSGPYVQYALVRARKVLQKAESEGEFDVRAVAEVDLKQQEKELLVKLDRFGEAVEKAATEYAPHHLCTYLFELAKNFSLFYTHCPILQAESDEQKMLRLGLTKAVAGVLEQGLGLLGIEKVERM
jgi:arginyl-tRNA synthetase